ncbi:MULTISPECIES: hypothetical protein [Alteromonadaceae]|uniref:hypothetical protein n=1 Tax=Alteromonadaceae TaxID=72275 RepID=UPI001C09BBCF|nr:MULTISPECIES: hypothetical protein [Aliiglaciecola]MBU2877895.1 hypothetical protein [Aliiglaciecola lipolytica]MDO6709258.1 hypothetical protein [Aliiglaciecola sp. 2_MG-2023]MDO6750406.1 hypothetical protein [Aliiglaciecola sp. 1_MG-2023]
MRKRNTLNRKMKPGNSSRRRLMLKKVHQKVLVRRQNFQQFDLQETFAEAS